MSLSRRTISNITYHKSSGKDDDSFVGLKIKGNEIHFYYPEAYHFEEDSKDLRNDIIAILSTIKIAKTQSKEKDELYTNRDNVSDFALDSYLWIIYDYMRNGYYVNREKEYKLNQKGKINWKRTLDTNPIISKSNNVIYNNVVVETPTNVDNIIVEIHKYCLKKSIDSIGWLFNLNSNFINVMAFNDTKKNYYLSALRKELNHTFDDDKKRRLIQFENVLKGLNAKLDNKDLVYGVDTYYYIYERMIDRVFGNEDVSKFYPKGEWYILKSDGAFEKKDSSDLRPDTILIHDYNGQKNAYILDSKFYRYGITDIESDLPSTSSIQKQVAYGDFVKTNKKNEFDNIYNAFLIPFDKKYDNRFKTDENLVYIGFSKTNISNKNNSHEFVHTFLIDLKHVITTWNKLNHDFDVNDLIRKIDLASNEVKKLCD